MRFSTATILGLVVTFGTLITGNGVRHLQLEARHVSVVPETSLIQARHDLIAPETTSLLQARDPGLSMGKWKPNIKKPSKEQLTYYGLAVGLPVVVLAGVGGAIYGVVKSGDAKCEKDPNACNGPPTCTPDPNCPHHKKRALDIAAGHLQPRDPAPFSAAHGAAIGGGSHGHSQGSSSSTCECN